MPKGTPCIFDHIHDSLCTAALGISNYKSNQ